ncbi:ISL3 family transposase [Brevibacterium casei]|uniref:ISL3 family transposase n=1 Tax=Brevibacterium casei TaxID=33889 RepID=A0A7T2WNY5_9MICO|nr:ISL3 family transposase [Brevibacterium casei]QPS33583.1 ISL3 family transposase [Brevibacterium casei]
MPHATFATPDLTTFTGLDDLGLIAVGQRITADRAVLECRLAVADPWCRSCGARGTSRGSISRSLAHEPFGHRPTTLLLRVRRYHCQHCGARWREDTTSAAPERAKLSHGGIRWALKALVIDHLSVSRIAAGLGVAWRTANEAVLAEGRRVLINDETRFDDVRVIGVDEHVWRHTRRGDKYVTVVIDLTPTRNKTGPARLLDMIEGRSKASFKAWLEARPEAWKKGVEVVAMDGFTGFKTATQDALPRAITVMDPFHVVRLAGDALDDCRRRVQQQLHKRRGRKDDPLYKTRRTLHTGTSLLTDRQCDRLSALFTAEQHIAVEAAWEVYQATVEAYREPDRTRARQRMEKIIAALGKNVPDALPELAKLGRTLTKRATDVLAFFDRPGTSNGPTEAINGRLEHLRGSALGFRNLVHYIARSLLEAGGFRPLLHP